MRYKVLVAFFLFTVKITAQMDRWEDCYPNKTAAAFTFNNFSIWPLPIDVPGSFHISVDLTVNRPVRSLFMTGTADNRFFAIELDIPCGSGPILSCQTDSIDCCEYKRYKTMPKILERFMFHLIGNDSYCPISAKSVVIQDEVIPITSASDWVAILSPNEYDWYEVTLEFKESRDAKRFARLHLL